MVHVLKAAPGISRILSGIYLKQNTLRGFNADKGRRNLNKLAKSHFCRSKTCCGSAKDWSYLHFPPFDLQFCFHFVLLHVVLSRAIVVIVESPISHNYSSCFLLALVGHISSEEHLRGVLKSAQLQRETSSCWANAAPWALQGMGVPGTHRTHRKSSSHRHSCPLK